MNIQTRLGQLNANSGLFKAAAAGVTTDAGLTVTATGLILYNPLASTVNLVVKRVGYAFTVAFAAAAAVGISVGNSASALTGITAATVYPNQAGTGGAGQGLAATAATLPAAPHVDTILGAGDTGAITTSPFGESAMYDVEGSIILTPGAYCKLYTSAASGASGTFASIEWYEVPANQ
jgi:hypothetical protein